MRSALVGLIALLGSTSIAAQAASQPETIIVDSGGLQLKALLWRPASTVPAPAVLFHHGGGCADALQAPRVLGPRFAQRGYAFLWLFRRGVGESRDQGECEFHQIARVREEKGDGAALDLQLQLMTTTQLADAMAGLRTLESIRGIDATRIVVAGHSFGAQLALLTAERSKHVRAVLGFAGAAAVWGRSENIRARLLDGVRSITVPVYLAYAEDDNAEPGRVLGAELTRLGKPHTLVIYPTGGHGFVFRAEHQSDADVFRFLAQHLKN